MILPREVRRDPAATGDGGCDEGAAAVDVLRAAGGEACLEADRVAVEEPLEVRVVAAAGGAPAQAVAVTMRTPGHDRELAAGFLYAEGIISSAADLAGPPIAGEGRNVVTARLAPGVAPNLASLERHFFATSACGVCGKAGLDQLAIRGCRPLGPGFSIADDTLRTMPARLQAGQRLFQATGGLHAAGAFDSRGRLLALREDVGRHNAVDKLVGWALLAGRLPLVDEAMLVSGRAGFEVVQKCLMARCPVLASVSAPSSLAVEVAAAFHVTLVGFLGSDRFNIYSGQWRIAGVEQPAT
ncbi:MAG: formate dehydrogenase accessory sulfurtransferase FdhD [Anaerolineae bacterium]